MREINKTTHVTDTFNKSSDKMWGGRGDKWVHRTHAHTATTRHPAALGSNTERTEERASCHVQWQTCDCDRTGPVLSIAEFSTREEVVRTLHTLCTECVWYTQRWRQDRTGDGTHSSTLARKIPWAEEPGGLQSMGSLRVGHDSATSLSLFTFVHWRRKWQPTPVFLPGESQGRGSLVGCRLWGRTESDRTEVT